MQRFFLELLENFVQFMSYSLYEEVFNVFDKLLYLTNDIMTESILKKCIVALVDKYTLKSKTHKNSMTTFMKSLMDIKLRKNLNKSRNSHHERKSNGAPGSPEFSDEMNEADLSGIQGQRPTGFSSYFEVMTEFCFFDNMDTVYKQVNKDMMHRMIDD